MKTIASNPHHDLVQLEISLKKLESLFNNGNLCAADVRCLNCTSKTCIWNLCLTSCAKKMHCKLGDLAAYPCCKQAINKSCNDFSVRIGIKYQNLKHIQ